MNTAIRFKHFVKTNDSHKVPECQIRGKHEIDSGGWRDYALLQERGIEFELQEDAEKFIALFGGEYTTRKVRKPNGDTSVS